MMLHNRFAGEALKKIDTLYKGGIHMNGQIVLCKGVNDGAELERSISDLTKYLPYMESVSVVPVGLSKYREGLYPLEPFTKEDAVAVLETIHKWQDKCMESHETHFVHASDEWYLLAEQPLPDEDNYDGYIQLENGVGMLRSFSDEFGMAVEDVEYMLSSVKEKRKVTVVTGVAAYDMLSAFAKKIEELSPMLTVNVVKIINKFFGESITVSGLLTGKDIYEQLLGVELGDELIIPESALRAQDLDFLCGMTLNELQDKLGVKVTPVGNDGYGFAEAVFGVCE
jgi:putative radical SAM enzyme (TIGR03279 family)